MVNKLSQRKKSKINREKKTRMKCKKKLRRMQYKISVTQIEFVREGNPEDRFPNETQRCFIICATDQKIGFCVGIFGKKSKR